MKKIMYFICLLIPLFTSSSYSQVCNHDYFLRDIANTYNKKVIKFEKITFKTIKKYERFKKEIFDSLSIINIPVVFSYKYISGGDIVAEKLLCYLNCRKIEYDEAIILKDSLYYGVVTQCPSSNCEVMYLDTNQILSEFMQPLAIKIREIKPDFIFRVYNIPEAYWYIKNKQLFVLTYEHQDKKMNDIKTFNIDTYLESVFKSSDILFLTTKRKK